MVMETQLNMEDGLNEIKDVINTVVKVQRYMNSQLEKAKGTVKPLSRERSGRVLDSRLRGCGFEPHRHYCVVSLSKNINPSLVLVQPRNTRYFNLKDC